MGGTLGSFVAEISHAVQSFSDTGIESKEILNQLAVSDPALFLAAGIRVVTDASLSHGVRYLVQTMAKDKRLSIGLLDANVCSVPEALAVVRVATEMGAQLQATFELALNKALQGQASPQKAQRITRILDILAVIGDSTCWNALQVELMAYPDKIVRSKAALLIGRSTRNVSWIARRLLDRDPRVQASAVEALWGLDPESVRPHFLAALKSGNARVAANAALGLYISGDAAATRVLLDMLRGDNPSLQLSALWAIGQTRDERFLPELADLYKRATGKLRLAAVGAMSKIRRRDNLAEEPNALHIHLSHAIAQIDGLRRLPFALSCHPARDLSAIKPTEFAVWENEKLIEDYQVRLAAPPAILMAGFIAPWSASDQAPYEKALREAFHQCLAMKRRDDLWRIDRYSIEINPQTEQKTPHETVPPYDDSLITPELKAANGCISDPDLLAKALTLPAPKARCAVDLLMAFERQSDAFAKRGGKRHVFLFLHDMSGADFKQEAGIERLRTLAHEGSIVLHGVCPDVAGQWALIRDLCLSNPEGTFVETKLDAIVDGLVDSYANLSSRYEISYSLPVMADPANVRLKISSGLGQGEISLQIAPPPAAAPSTPTPEPQPAMSEQPVAEQPV